MYDRRSELLLTNDTVYPGRLYVFGARNGGQWDVFRTSVRRLADFAAAHPVRWVLGCRVEMTRRPGEDFPYGTSYHPDEHVLPLEPGDLFELDAALQQHADPRLIVLDHFIVHPIL